MIVSVLWSCWSSSFKFYFRHFYTTFLIQIASAESGIRRSRLVISATRRHGSLICLAVSAVPKALADLENLTGLAVPSMGGQSSLSAIRRPQGEPHDSRGLPSRLGLGDHYASPLAARPSEMSSRVNAPIESRASCAAFSMASLVRESSFSASVAGNVTGLIKPMVNNFIFKYFLSNRKAYLVE